MTTTNYPNHPQHSDLALENALVHISSTYAKGWEWEVFYQEEPGLFRAFVKSPFCPDGEYGIAAASDWKDIPFLFISTHTNVYENIDLMPYSLGLMSQINKAMR